MIPISMNLFILLKKLALIEMTEDTATNLKTNKRETRYNLLTYDNSLKWKMLHVPYPLKHKILKQIPKAKKKFVGPNSFSNPSNVRTTPKCHSRPFQPTNQ
jgi:hypothetical protein